MGSFPLLAAALLLLIAAPLLLEALAAFVFARRYVSPHAAFRAFRAALVSWLTYNRHGAVGPAVFQSPAGTYRERRAMTVAVIVLFAAGLSSLFSLYRDALARSDYAKPAFRGRKAPSLAQRLRDADFFPNFGAVPRASPSPGPPDRVFQAPTTPEPDAAPQPGAPLAGQPPARPKAQPPKSEKQPEDDPEGLKLQPYQKELLSLMPPDEREEYLARLRKQQTPAVPIDEPDTPTRLTSVQDTNERLGRQWFAMAFMLMFFGLFYSLYPILTALLSVAFFLGSCFTTAARVAGFWGQELGTADPERLFATETWDDLVRRVQKSRDQIEKHSLLLGVNAFDDTPVIVLREVFAEHAHLLGDSGSGKTSLGLASLLAQFIRFRDSSVVVIDLKADDLALFEGARKEAQRADLRFRWFTNELHRSTYVFNPLTQRHFAGLTTYQQADVLACAMGLQYGTEYGASYFSDANTNLLYQALCKRAGISSFAELAELLAAKHTIKMDPELRKAASHLHASVDRLAAFEPLNATLAAGYPGSAIENAIDFADVFSTPQVVYFHLPASLGSTSSADIARFALYSLLSAAKSLGPARRERQVYLFIDEFQRIVAHNLEIVLQTARSMNIGVILANQTLMDLHVPGANLIPTVRANTRFKQIFAASDLAEQQEIGHTSGEAVVLTSTWTEYLGPTAGAAGDRSRTKSETITPRLRPNDILLASDHPQQSIVCITRGKGYAQFGGMPFIMTSAYHIDLTEYQKRRTAAWPDCPDETITPPVHAPLRQKELPLSQPEPERPDPVLGKPDAVIDTGQPKPTPAEQKSLPLDALDAHWKSQQRRSTGGRKPRATDR